MMDSPDKKLVFPDIAKLSNNEMEQLGNDLRRLHEQAGPIAEQVSQEITKAQIADKRRLYVAKHASQAEMTKTLVYGGVALGCGLLLGWFMGGFGGDR
jgi:hypothetical protein